MASLKQTNPFKYMDRLLSKYYQSLKDESYFESKEQWHDDQTAKGKFTIYCETNGVEFEQVDDEFADSTAAESLFVDFDPAFPFHPLATTTTNTEEQKQTEIYRVLKHCWDLGKPPNFNPFLNVEWSVDTKQAVNRYSKQCPIIFGQNESTLTQVFAIGLHHQVPFIAYICDAFQRDRMRSAGSPDQQIPSACDEWVKKAPMIAAICQGSEKRKDILSSAIETYLARTAPRFNFRPLRVIDDSAVSVVQYFAHSARFVQTLIDTPQSTATPFSYDAVIVLNQTKSNEEMLMPDFGDDDHEENDDDASDEEDTKEDDAYFANLTDRLKHNNCVSVKKTCSVLATGGGTRFLEPAFADLKATLQKTKYANNGKSYPHRKRFCSLIDRRASSSSKSKPKAADDDDTLYMFEPPDDCNTIPMEHVPEWYFEAGKKCVLPSKNWAKERHEKMSPHSIRVEGLGHSRQLTFSFHVESARIIRCYMFWMGFYIRIVHAHDLIILFKHMFNLEFAGNGKYLNSAKAKQDLADVKLIDDAFDAFYEDISIVPKQLT